MERNIRIYAPNCCQRGCLFTDTTIYLLAGKAANSSHISDCPQVNIDLSCTCKLIAWTKHTFGRISVIFVEDKGIRVSPFLLCCFRHCDFLPMMRIILKIIKANWTKWGQLSVRESIAAPAFAWYYTSISELIAIVKAAMKWDCCWHCYFSAANIKHE